MAKIWVTLEGAILQEVPISKSKITIGRRLTNDIVLNNLAISGTHAVIKTKTNDSFLEDLNSTNGTRVNGQPIKRHFLQNGDVILLAGYKLKFEIDAVQSAVTHEHIDASDIASVKHGVVKVLNGSNAEKQFMLKKELTTFGTPGIHVATISCVNNAYFLMHVEGVQPTRVNDVAIGHSVYEMKPGDVIDLSGTQLMFNFV